MGTVWRATPFESGEKAESPLRKGAIRTGVIAGALLAGTLIARAAGYRMGPHTVVRCRAGHLFTTIWVPGASLKALRLGWWRLQRCPVGHHWSLVAPVRESDLTDEERRSAAVHHDVRIP
jgi:hypothetical protein